MAIVQFSDPIARQEASRRQVEAMRAGKYTRVSKLEDLVARELDLLGCEYQRQVSVNDGSKACCVDFLLSDGRVLEVNGTYWHADPRRYINGPVHASQKHTCQKYEEKKQLLVRLNITLLELWEDDFKTNPKAATERALRFHG